MSIADIQNQLEQLSATERRQLSAFLVSLRHKELGGYRDSLAEKIDDENPSNWVSFAEFDKRITA